LALLALAAAGLLLGAVGFLVPVAGRAPLALALLLTAVGLLDTGLVAAAALSGLLAALLLAVVEGAEKTGIRLSRPWHGIK
jgi:tetrahydromethanopterin S-methyltransferase subunit D